MLVRQTDSSMLDLLVVEVETIAAALGGPTRLTFRQLRQDAHDRSAETQVSAALQPSVDNCYRDQAVTNAAQLADLLGGAEAKVARPGG